MTMITNLLVFLMVEHELSELENACIHGLEKLGLTLNASVKVVNSTLKLIISATKRRLKFLFKNFTDQFYNYSSNLLLLLYIYYITLLEKITEFIRA